MRSNLLCLFCSLVLGIESYSRKGSGGRIPLFGRSLLRGGVAGLGAPRAGAEERVTFDVLGAFLADFFDGFNAVEDDALRDLLDLPFFFVGRDGRPLVSVYAESSSSPLLGEEDEDDDDGEGCWLR